MVGTHAGSGATSLESKLVEHLRYRARGAPHGDLATTTRNLVAAAASGSPQADITGSATRWAREGVALETVLGAYHDGIRTGLEFLAEQATDADQVMAGARLMVRVLETVTVAASAAYVDEHRQVAREQQTAAQTLVSALLSGYGVTQLARQTGIAIASSYQVVALSIPPHADERRPGIATPSAARRKLRRVQAALATPLGSRALSLLSTDGGTVLVPIDDASVRTPLAMTADVLELLSEAAEVPVTATVGTGDTVRIPELAARAHELLERLLVASRPPGLYPMADLLEAIGCDTAGYDKPQQAHRPVVTSPNDRRIGRTA
ncbi:transcriptional regulator [Nocardia sp. GCM10030253]|uniref:transcriptional regulator n=1 Tax=Nocardia sp. GCM10030253 TaxID=3273404 RepID=UPI003636ADC9